MCTAFISYKNHPIFKLIVASNRDEFLDRPAMPLHRWDNESGIIAGKDLTHGGIWFGVNKYGKFGLLTNFRDFHNPRVNGPSRGLLLADYLSGDYSAGEYADKINESNQIYDGYNLLISDYDDLYYHSNKKEGNKKLNPGIYGLSNAYLDTPWPKVKYGKEKFSSIINGESSLDELFTLLHDEKKYPPELLPDTGVSPDMEHWLSSLFISGDKYGTRVSTILTIGYNEEATITELTYPSLEQVQFSFKIKK